MPADGRLLVAATLEIEEAALTGESAPVLKDRRRSRRRCRLGDRLCLAFMNTSVTRGRGEMIVTGTGMNTEIGNIATLLNQTEADKTPLQKQLDRLTQIIVGIAGLAFVAMVRARASRTTRTSTRCSSRAWRWRSRRSRPGLPAVVTTLYSMGTRVLAEHNAIVKRLPSVETLGSVSAICSDKTGTLTLNKMTARELVVPGHNRFTISGEGYATRGDQARRWRRDRSRRRAVADGAVRGRPARRRRRPDRRPDRGCAHRARRQGRDRPRRGPRALPRVAEVPFDSEYKFMATFHRMDDRSGQAVVRCFVKGAPDVLIDRAAPTGRPTVTSTTSPLDRRTAAPWRRTTAWPSRASGSWWSPAATSTPTTSTRPGI